VLACSAAVAAAWSLPSIAAVPPARDEFRDVTAAGVVAALTLPTVALTLLLVGCALRSTTPARAVAWCVAGGALAGTFNAGLCLSCLQLVHGNPHWPIGLLIGTLFGGVFGAPLGLLYGAAYGLIVGPAVRARLDPSHDGADRTLLFAGLWAAAAGVLLTCATAAVGSPLPPAALAAAGLALAGVGGARLALRDAWLARVAEGRDERFRIAPRDGDDDEVRLRSLVRSARAPDHVLFERVPGGAPYRGRGVWSPVALVPAPRSPAPAASRGGRAARDAAPGGGDRT
jgi:hypothetical protein